MIPIIPYSYYYKMRDPPSPDPKTLSFVPLSFVTLGLRPSSALVKGYIPWFRRKKTNLGNTKENFLINLNPEGAALNPCNSRLSPNGVALKEPLQITIMRKPSFTTYPSYGNFN